MQQMDKLRSLLTKIVTRETITYIIFGILTTVVSYVVGTLCYYTLPIALDELLNVVSNCISWVCAVTFAYITNKLYVFQSKEWSASILKHEIPSFLGARVFSLVVELFFMWVLVDCLGLMYAIGKILINVVVVILNYLFSKLFIFRHKK